MNNFLKLKNISKHFDTEKKIKVLKNLSYNFNKGKIYALMGPSGSGKSTLLNLISLIDRPTIGSIRFDNELVNFSNNKKNDIFRAKKIGIVYQQNNLLSDFTALENVYLANLSIYNDKDLAGALTKNFSSSAIDNVKISSTGMNSDIHASSDYRANMVKVFAKKAVDAC